MARRDQRTATEVRHHRDAAASALERGRFDAALGAYTALESLEPDEPDWPKRMADCLRRLGRRELELAALERAAAKYARGGFTVKAVAVCKRILGLDPSHRATQAKLEELHGARATGLARVASAALGGPAFPAALPLVLPEPPLEPAADGASPRIARPANVDLPPPPTLGAPPSMARPSLPPGAALESVAVASLAPSRPTRGLLPQEAAVTELWLDDTELLDVPVSAPAEIAVSGPGEPGPGEVAAAALPYTPLFSEVSQETFRYLIEHVRLLELDAGETIFREGDHPDALYVIAEGQVEVVAEGPPRARIGTLGDGDFFGEIGLLSDVPRQRTIAALETTRLLVLDRRLVSALVDRDPAFLRVLLRFLRERLVATLFRSSELFAPFGPAEQTHLVSQFRFLELDAGTTLIERGRAAEGLFVLLSGAAEVIVDEPPRRLAELGTGDVFGEMSLLGNALPVATVRTTQKAFALLMPARAFTETVMTHPHVLLYTSELADRRAALNLARTDTLGPFAEGHLELV